MRESESKSVAGVLPSTNPTDGSHRGVARVGRWHMEASCYQSVPSPCPDQRHKAPHLSSPLADFQGGVSTC